MVGKTHRLDGCELQVQLCSAPPPLELQPTYSDRVLVSGIRDCTTKDCLINYLEVQAQCDIQEDNVFFGDKEGMAVVIFSEMPGM